jgi:hypothetical protein
MSIADRNGVECLWRLKPFNFRSLPDWRLDIHHPKFSSSKIDILRFLK